ncbi:MAG TPA: hypothetical protein VNS63_16310 [Blastocatellia bacterium]|nr:hypothetical protein [Blastocatellia bacterium]
MSAVEQFKDVDNIRSEAASLLYDGAVQFISSIDQWAADSNRARNPADVAYCRHQKRLTLAFLYRLFPERVADTARIAR